MSDLPPSHETTVYVCYSLKGWNEGHITAFCFDPTKDNEEPEYLVIASKKVKIPIPPQDVTARHVEALEKIKKSVMAKSEILLNEIQTKIDSLLAIEYKGDCNE